jgi:hypothetical protein
VGCCCASECSSSTQLFVSIHYNRYNTTVTSMHSHELISFKYTSHILRSIQSYTFDAQRLDNVNTRFVTTITADVRCYYFQCLLLCHSCAVSVQLLYVTVVRCASERQLLQTCLCFRNSTSWHSDATLYCYCCITQATCLPYTK